MPDSYASLTSLNAALFQVHMHSPSRWLTECIDQVQGKSSAAVTAAESILYVGDTDLPDALS